MGKKKLLILVFSLLFTACYIDIRENVSNPEYYIKKAVREFERVERPDFFRSRKATSINIFVYDGESKDMIRVSLPLWFLNLCFDIAGDFNDEEKPIDNPSKWDCEVDFQALKELKKLGPGPLMELRDGKSLILIWMR